MSEAQENSLRGRDLIGDLHVHSAQNEQLVGSHDSKLQAEDIVQWIKSDHMRLKYLALTEHAEGIAGALSGKPFDPGAQYDPRDYYPIQKARIDKLNAEHPGLKIISGLEVGILGDGSLSVTDETMRQAELVVASVHFNEDDPPDKLTQRIITAMRHPLVDIVAHIGRNSNHWQGIDWEKIAIEARDRDIAIEVNMQHVSEDSRDPKFKRLKEPTSYPEVLEKLGKSGVDISLATDIHKSIAISENVAMTQQQLRALAGIVRELNMAGFTRDRVINTWPVQDVLAWAKNNNESAK